MNSGVQVSSARTSAFVLFGRPLIFLAVVVTRQGRPRLPASLRGQVTDPSGAAVAGATVLVLPAEGASITRTTNRDGILRGKGSHSGQLHGPSLRDRICSI